MLFVLLLLALRPVWSQVALGTEVTEATYSDSSCSTMSGSMTTWSADQINSGSGPGTLWGIEGTCMTTGDDSMRWYYEQMGMNEWNECYAVIPATGDYMKATCTGGGSTNPQKTSPPTSCTMCKNGKSSDCEDIRTQKLCQSKIASGQTLNNPADPGCFWQGDDQDSGQDYYGAGCGDLYHKKCKPCGDTNTKGESCEQWFDQISCAANGCSWSGYILGQDCGLQKAVEAFGKAILVIIIVGVLLTICIIVAVLVCCCGVTVCCIKANKKDGAQGNVNQA